MHYLPKNRESGFTLVEMLIAMTIGLIILTALSSTFLIQRKTYDVQEQIVEMVQTARAAMDMMTREIRMAGYNPAGVSFDGIPYNADSSTIDVYADLNGNGSIDTTSGTYEHITYLYDSTNNQIDRNTNTGGGNQPFAENIETFEVLCLKADGVTEVTTTAENADIRQIRITITARTTEADADYSTNGGYRTHTLTSLITPRNLGL
ncbi:MAG TPA: prepilin-type N-terminal cleavage/methylation domain-containing protein [Anaerolineae bacterium]|nr:prepilin-type N-terminal cleavage/methylation domain-containing protein [Anaerolineae bacterium]